MARMPEDFVVARNPDPDSSLPYLLRIPLGDTGVILKARETWPRTSKVYCHREDAWPADAEIVERVPTRSCVRRGAAIELVLERGRENRSQIVLSTPARPPVSGRRSRAASAQLSARLPAVAAQADGEGLAPGGPVGGEERAVGDARRPAGSRAGEALGEAGGRGGEVEHRAQILRLHRSVY